MTRAVKAPFAAAHLQGSIFGACAVCQLFDCLDRIDDPGIDQCIGAAFAGEALGTDIDDTRALLHVLELKPAMYMRLVALVGLPELGGEIFLFGNYDAKLQSKENKRQQQQCPWQLVGALLVGRKPMRAGASFLKVTAKALVSKLI